MNCSFKGCKVGVGLRQAEIGWLAVEVCVAFLFCISFAHAQASQGRILGTVTDQTGGVMAGAMVTVVDTQRGVRRTLIADDSGEYNAPNLTPGTYTVRAEAKGFKSVERAGVLIETGSEIRIDLSLPPGAQTETITVSEALPLVETTNATLGGTLSNQTINDLPLNGRNYQNLLAMRPGVLAEPGGGTWTQSTNGVRPEDNVYLVGGMYNVGAFSALSILNAPALAGDAASILPIDAIQEFNTEENPRAEYGWKPGAIINVGIKSGTNSIHGTAYAFGRDTAFDARNYFNQTANGCTAPCSKTEVALEQYGATVGGPIKKDKIFFFAGYEGQRYSVGSPFLANAPVTVSLAGAASAAKGSTFSVPDAETDLNNNGCAAGKPLNGTQYCTGTTANLSALTLNLLNNFYPANPNTNGSTPTIISADFPSTFASDNWVAKLDFHLNDEHTLSGMYFIANSIVHDEDAAYLQPQFLTAQTQRPEVGNANWTWTPNSRWVNEAQFGVQYLLKPSFVGDHTVNPTTYGLNTGVTNPLYFGMPQIMVTGFTNLGGGSWPKIQGPETDFIVQDHVSYLVGKHSFKFGGEIINDNFTGGALNTSRGNVRFGSGTVPGTTFAATALEDFLLGVPNRGQLLVGNASRRVYNDGYAAFFQDDWRVEPRLILNLGLRYEVNTVIQDANDQLGNFLPTAGLVQVGSGITSPYNGDHNNFAPRVGLAWDIFGNGKTVFRAGGGVVYEQLSYSVFLAYSNTLGLGTVPTGALLNGAPNPNGGNIGVAAFTYSASKVNWDGSSVGGSTIFPTGAVSCTTAAPCSTVAVNPNLRTPYVTTWTAEIQRSLASNLSLEIGYVGDHGTKLVGFRDMNQLNPATGLRPFSVPFPYLSYIYQLSNQDVSNYDSLQATLTKRASHGLSFTAGYTYSHALDIASSNFGGGIPQNSGQPRADYGNSNFDIRHRFTLTTTYTLPGRKGFGQMLEGWQLNSLVALQTAQPWNAIDGTSNVSGTTENVDHWDFFGNPSDFSSVIGPGGIPCWSGNKNLTCATGAAGSGGTTVTPAPAVCTNAAAANGLSNSLTGTGMPSTFPAGCYYSNNSALIAPSQNSFGTAGRNIFRGRGFRDWDLSVTKEWTLRERLRTQFRAEVFNILNHPNFATPGVNGAGSNNPDATQFGCSCATPDTAASNPVLGSGGSRAMQLGLKLNW